MVDAKNVAVMAAPPQRGKKTAKKHPGLAALADQLAALRGDSSAAVASARRMTVTDSIKEAANMFFHGAPVNADARKYWAETAEFQMLVPGAHYLLSHSIGNAFGERCLSKAQHLLSNKRVMQLDVQRKLLLNLNGKRLGLSGYERVWTSADSGSDDDDDDADADRG